MKIRDRLNGHDASEYRPKMKILFAIVAVCLSILIVRLWYLQVIRGDELKQRSENNSIRLRKIVPSRGYIMDRNGLVLVENQPAFNIVYVPNRAKDIHGILKKMEHLYAENSLSFPSDPFLNKSIKPFVPIKLEKNISREKLALVETNAIDLPGISIEVVPVRKYSGDKMMSQIIGYIGEISQKELEKNETGDYSSGDFIGKQGIERYLDPYLRGKNGAERVEVNALGRTLKTVGAIEPTPGHNIVLTIDYALQKTAWDAIDGKAGSVVVMDPRDGSILVMASSPSFDSNLFLGGISFADWERLASDPLYPMENRAISGQYPPGSTYKPIIAAAALQEGIITPDTTFFCDGTFSFGNRTFRCWQKHGHGNVNLHRAIVESCDVYFYNVGKMLGVDKLHEYARGFGLGEQTGVDLPREKSGLVPSKQWKMKRFGNAWQPGETISISIGQGYNLVTPLQLLNAYCALANGGTLYRPIIIRRIDTPDGKPYKVFNPEKRGKIPVSQKNIDILNYALWGVVNEGGGTGYALRRAEADVCGKTGTSQVVGLPSDEKARRLKQMALRYKDHALFVCFAPYKNPEIAVAVVMENAGGGGAAAAPVARKIIDAYFNAKTPVKKRQPLMADHTAGENRG
ncbi:MAG: penicillin-binding protein 2 [Deltaproteobacteria bacterium]|nr:penicillin-binding protein 2 [Deltaproteobacteria bacterium]